nr:FtsH protease activity modulator HflK [Oceanococcus sp. HetDA_MAG_MS8]
MAWNEPGSNNPWDKQGPPDLEDLFKKFRQKFGGGGGGSPSGGLPIGLISFVAGIALVVWLFSGFYIIQPGERGVVLQFGKYLTTTGEGPHWHVPPPIQRVEKVNVDGIRNVTDRQVMLTQDENIVDLELAVQYRVSDAQKYLFETRDPDLTLTHALKSALREVVGKSSMDFILTAGREEVAERTKLLLQETLDTYSTGLVVTEVNIKDAQPPDPVQGAFADAIKAREDEQRLINEAEAYANEVVPVARGEATRRVAEANAYQSRVVEAASGDASRFTQLLEEYQRAPEVTRERLYLDAMGDVLNGASKVVLDTDSSNPLLYLPLDKVMNRRPSDTEANDMRGNASLSQQLGKAARDSAIRSQRSSNGREASRERGRR